MDEVIVEYLYPSVRDIYLLVRRCIVYFVEKVVGAPEGY